MDELIALEPYKIHRIKVSDIHEIYVEESGNPDGIALIRIHGGPGGRSKAEHRTEYDLDKYRVILRDQRGCGQSKPLGELVDNDIRHNVEDMEKIRQELNINKWVIVGGSRGSAVAIAYMTRYADRVLHYLGYGIFAASEKEWDWIGSVGGASKIFPDIRDKMIEVVPEQFKDRPYDYFKSEILDKENIDDDIIWHWSYREGYIGTLLPREDRKNMVFEMNDEIKMSAKVFFHYLKSGSGLSEELLQKKNIDLIKDVPCDMVQGRYDVVCPMVTAWKLHKLWSGSRLHIVDDAGHSGGEINTEKKLNEILDSLVF